MPPPPFARAGNPHIGSAARRGKRHVGLPPHSTPIPEQRRGKGIRRHPRRGSLRLDTRSAFQWRAGRSTEGRAPDTRIMRPEQITPLFANAKSLAGIGPRMEILLRKALRLQPGVTEPRVIDLLWHTPTGVIDRRATPTVAAALPGTIATLEVRVGKHKPTPRGNTRAPYKVTCEDDSGRIDLVFFHAERRFIERQLPTGSIRTVSGRIESYNDRKQMTHPDYIVAPEVRADLPLLEPIYPLTAGLSGKVLLKAARHALERVPSLPEWQDWAWLAQRGWPDARSALLRLHRPQDA